MSDIQKMLMNLFYVVERDRYSLNLNKMQEFFNETLDKSIDQISVDHLPEEASKFVKELRESDIRKCGDYMGYLFSRSQIKNNLEISITFYKAHINVLGKREWSNWVLGAKGLSIVYEMEGSQESLRLQKELREEFRKREVVRDIRRIALSMMKIILFVILTSVRVKQNTASCVP